MMPFFAAAASVTIWWRQGRRRMVFIEVPAKHTRTNAPSAFLDFYCP